RREVLPDVVLVLPGLGQQIARAVVAVARAAEHHQRGRAGAGHQRAVAGAGQGPRDAEPDRRAGLAPERAAVALFARLLDPVAARAGRRGAAVAAARAAACAATPAAADTAARCGAGASAAGPRAA